MSGLSFLVSQTAIQLAELIRGAMVESPGYSAPGWRVEKTQYCDLHQLPEARGL